jgi:hypothetical protein
MADCALVESRESPDASHMTTCVSRRINTDRPTPLGEGRRNNISCDFDFSFEEAEDVVFFLFDGDEFGHRLAALGDEHRLALGLNFIHDLQAMDFELACGHCFHASKTSRSWSLYYGRKNRERYLRLIT